MKIPKTLKIGNLTYKIEYIEDKFEEPDFYGRGWMKEQRIKLNPNLKQELLEQTFIHEIMHQILDAGSYDEESKNEKLVETLTNGIYQVFKENNLLK
jgi:predicted SprT family Zn-dependent metalloprotease